MLARNDAPMLNESVVSGAQRAEARQRPRYRMPPRFRCPRRTRTSDSVVSSMIIRTGQASVQVDSLEQGHPRGTRARGARRWLHREQLDRGRHRPDSLGDTRDQDSRGAIR